MIKSVSEYNKKKLSSNINAFKSELCEAAYRAKRDINVIQTTIVTKYQSLSLFPLLQEHGFLHIGESRVSQAIEKKREAEENGLFFSWHLIGSLQKNKVKKALSCCNLIEVVDSLELARALSKENLFDKKFFLQVNPISESSKRGFDPKLLEKEEILLELQMLLGSHIQGLMAMAPDRRLYGDKKVHESFSLVENLYHTIRNRAIFDSTCFSSLSMGMSNDFEIALLYGATHVRIGSKIFEGLEEYN